MLEDERANKLGNNLTAKQLRKRILSGLGESSGSNY